MNHPVNEKRIALLAKSGGSSPYRVVFAENKKKPQTLAVAAAVVRKMAKLLKLRGSKG